MSETSSSPVLHTAEQLNDLRQRVLNGEELSHEEYRNVILSYRTHRAGAVSAAAPKVKARAAAAEKAAPVALDTLLSGLGL